jgi:hypothetical protein
MVHYYIKPNNNWMGPFSKNEFDKEIKKYPADVEHWNTTYCPNGVIHPLLCDHRQPLDPPLSLPTPERKPYWLILFSISILAIVYVFGFVSPTPKPPAPKPPKPPIVVPIEVQINVTNTWNHYTLKGISNGKKATFEIAFLSNEYCWDYGSAQFVSGRQNAVLRIKEQINQFPPFEQAIGLIAVGTASQERNAMNGAAIEYRRSQNRATTEMRALRQNRRTNGKNLYKFYLGYFQRTTREAASETDYQRRVIIIGIMEQDRSMTASEVGAALQNALSDPSKKHPLRLDDYANKGFESIVHRKFKN